MKKLIIPLITIILLSIIVSANITKEDVFKELKSNEAQNTTSIITINNPELLTINKEKLEITFKEICGKVINYEIQTIQNCEKTEPIYTTKETCIEQETNTTTKTTCYNKTTQTGTKTTTYSCYKTTPYIYVGQKDYRIKATIKKEECKDGYGYKIDWIPRIEIQGTTYEETNWAWWNISFNKKRPINCTNITNGFPIMINGTHGIKIDNETQYIWTTCAGTSTSLYYNNKTSYVVANDTETLPIEIEEGSGNNYNPTNLWTNYRRIYHFNEETGTIANDSTQNTNGNITDAQINQTGIISKAYNFDGTTDLVTVDKVSPWTNNTGDKVWSFWTKPSSTKANNNIIFDRNADAKCQHYGIITQNFITSCDMGTWKEINYSTFNINRIYYMTITLDYNNILRLYVNATEIGNISIAGLSHDADSIGSFIGGSTSNGAWTYDGIIDEIRYTENLMTPQQITQEYQNIIGTKGYGNIEQEQQQTPPNITLNNPENNTPIYNNTPSFNFTSTDPTYTTTNCTVKANNTLIGTNQSVHNNTPTTITSNTTLQNDSTYLWNVTCNNGISTGTSTTWQFIIPSCTENWTATQTACNVSDQQIKIYNDTNNCGTNYTLPIDNGTNQNCNYCTEELQQINGTCINQQQNTTWQDNNYLTCCAITGLTSDCSILYTPYNETTTTNCTSLLTQFTCYYDEQPIMKDKINVVCEMPDNQTYCCVTNTYQNNNLLATNPEYQVTSTSLINLKTEQELRTCFTPNQRLVNTYYTPKNIRTDTEFTIEVLCTSTNGTNIKSQHLITPTYDKPDWILNRLVWSKENIPTIMATIFVLIIIILMIAWGIKQLRGR